MKNFKTKALGFLTLAASLTTGAAVQAQAVVPEVVQDAIDAATGEMSATGYALLGILVVVLGFAWLRRVMK